MTQRDEGHNYRDSKNKAREYQRKQKYEAIINMVIRWLDCLLYTSPSPRDRQKSRMPSSA